MESTLTDFQVERSRAISPLFYRAPVPPLPPGVRLKEYQHAAVEYALARNHCLIGDAPGLGKTAEAICLSNALDAQRNLVVCPASLRLNWEREIWTWSTLPNVSTYPVLKSSDGVSLAHNYVIVSYDLLRNEAVLEALMAGRWDHLILDEAHYLKDPQGNKRTKVLCAPDLLPSVVGRITMLSGTVLPNQPIECYNAIRLLDWEAINCLSLKNFREAYYEKGGGMVRGPVFIDRDSNGFLIEPRWVNKLHWSNEVRNVPINLADLQHRLRSHIMVRRLKEQVLHELPKKRWHPFPLATTPAIRKALKHEGWKQAEKLYELDPTSFDKGIPIDGAISTARRELGEAKAPAVADYIEDLLSSGVEKLVVAAWHHTVLDYLRSRLAQYGLVYMDGNTTPVKKQLAVDAFQIDEDIRIILGQMIPLGEGCTLTQAQDVVLCEPDWVPGKNDQLLDRIHRIGQVGGYVLGHVPVVPGTLDEKILSTAIRKDINIFAALDKQA
ncbi:MAG: DEAD/DEAH box helicase [Acidiferrobacterales bacterium]